MSLSLVSPKIVNIAYVLEFSQLVRDVRYQQQKVESIFSEMMGGQANQTNVVDSADPSIPRLVFKSGKRQINISQTQCGLQFDFRGQGLKNSMAQEVAFKKIREFHSAAFLGWNVFEHAALIFNLEQKSNLPQEDIKNELFDNFLKTPKFGEIASVEVKMGFLKENHYINLTSGNFEEREFKTDSRSLPSKEPIFLKIDELALKSYGAAYQIDINSRPSSLAGRKLSEDSVDAIINIAQSFLSEKFQEITGQTL